MFSSGGTCSAPFAANFIMFDGNLEARIRSIERGMSSLPELARKRTAKTGLTSRVFQLPDRKFQFSHQPIRFASKKLLQQGPIVPKSSLATAIEPRPDRFSDLPVVGK